MTALVLSLFPGGGLFCRAFEEAGFQVVRGPDLLWGGDVRSFHVPAGVFAGVIGGPPCKFASLAAFTGTTAEDLIPEFVRVVDEAGPGFVVMENVRQAGRRSRSIPRHWWPATLRDWDCGGETHRIRNFWTWPFLVAPPARRPGTPSLSVLASTGRRGSGAHPRGDTPMLDCKLSIEEYGRLQGHPEIASALKDQKAGKEYAVSVLGNGVPRALGRWVARAAWEHVHG